ncbi:alcohol dehydrogenase [Thecamonas trahens ATCC 50062]|uniref:Alcohol dehydrogenase n=1 Tax=Thecamonas trahens ATCC 50062 TaxID=461836 RepID=A0A0L0D8G9_THETB|nr:alcohol dehydrogenase [Thecamonas trahens ATCC 50062]KNC48381.1 alcohol dehydrogenase [Thecamonas trahens ATCC 50062]|eukprot:XP_013758498.1 alcohol dehydrogenase [Thecamonas trahens ATCC 50062]
MAGNNYPMVPGHEIVGTVTAVGPAVSLVAVGDRVGVGPQGGACMDGEACRECGREANNFCPKRVFTYNSPIPNPPGVTYGGYAEAHITHEAFAIPIPDGMDSAVAAPLLCAGITTYSPLVHFGKGLKPGARVGVVGIGGLGHMGVQYAAALGYSVTAISRTPSKEAEAQTFGATSFLLSSDADAMAAAQGTFDFILCTVSASLPWELFLGLCAPDGVFCMLGLPPSP